MSVHYIIKASFHPIWTYFRLLSLYWSVKGRLLQGESVLIGKSVKLNWCVSMSFCTEEVRVQVSAYNRIKYNATTQRRTWWSAESSKGGCPNVPVEVAMSPGGGLGGIPHRSTPGCISYWPVSCKKFLLKWCDIVMGEFPHAMWESKRQRSLVNIFGANQTQSSPILRLWLKMQPVANILSYGGKPSGQGLTMPGLQIWLSCLGRGSSRQE